MPNKWKLYPLKAKLIFIGETKSKDIPVTIIDYFDTEKSPATYVVRTNDGVEMICSHDELKPPEPEK